MGNFFAAGCFMTDRTVKRIEQPRGRSASIDANFRRLTERASQKLARLFRHRDEWFHESQ